MVIQRLKRAKRRWKGLLFFVVSLSALNIYYLSTTPTNQGPWQVQYEKLAKVEFDDSNNLSKANATIYNFRRARYNEKGAPTATAWTQREVNLNDLKSVWYGISVFSSPGLAHTFLSFDFGNEDPVVISVEARMRPEQSYSPVQGILDQFHLIYVIADERDIIGVRTHKRAEEVYFFPIKANKVRRQKMFIDMVNRANSLNETPEFYNTFTSNCTNSIMKETQIPAWQYYLDPRIVLPAFSDEIAYQYKVLDQNYDLELLREAARIPTHRFTDNDTDFYHKIRENYFQVLEGVAKKSP